MSSEERQRQQRLLGAVSAAVAAALGVAGEASGEGYSIDAASPSVASGSNSAYLSSGPVGGPPVVEESPAALGLVGGSTDEINAMTFGGPTNVDRFNAFHFSVDRASVGVAGDIVAEAALGQAAGDVYMMITPGTNVLVVNQDALGLTPASTAGSPATPPIDDVDAFDFDYSGPGGPILTGYTLAAGHPLSGTAIGCGGDIFLNGAATISYAAGLGLASCADDVDALEGDGTLFTFFFSLAPGSPSLAPGSPISGCASGCSPADIFIKQSGSPAALLIPAADLGLLATDNVDALALAPPPPEPEPVPGLSRSSALGLVALMLWGTRFAARPAAARPDRTAGAGGESRRRRSPSRSAAASPGSACSPR